MQAAQIQVDSAALPACSEIGEMAAVTRPVGVRVVEWVVRWRLALGDLGVAGCATCLDARVHMLSEARRRVTRPGSAVGGRDSAIRSSGIHVHVPVGWFTCYYLLVSTASKYCAASSIGAAWMVSVGEQPTEMPAAMGSVVLSHIRFFQGRCAESARVPGFIGGAIRPMHRLATRSGRDAALIVVQNIRDA